MHQKAPSHDAQGADLPHRLASGAKVLGLTPSDTQLRSLLDYLALLQRWNSVYNLSAVREPAAMLGLHLLDCLAAVAPVRREVEGMAAPRALDVGSGAGLPGVVLAIMCPDLQVTCIDTVGKKVAFIQQAIGDLELPNLFAVHGRVEQHRAVPYDLIASRAFASLVDFVRLTQSHLAADGRWMAMKGRRPDDEIQRLPADVDVFHVEPLQVPELDAERCIVWMRKRVVY